MEINVFCFMVGLLLGGFGLGLPWPRLPGLMVATAMASAEAPARPEHTIVVEKTIAPSCSPLQRQLMEEISEAMPHVRMKVTDTVPSQITSFLWRLSCADTHSANIRTLLLKPELDPTKEFRFRWLPTRRAFHPEDILSFQKSHQPQERSHLSDLDVRGGIDHEPPKDFHGPKIGEAPPLIPPNSNTYFPFHSDLGPWKDLLAPKKSSALPWWIWSLVGIGVAGGTGLLIWKQTQSSSPLKILSR